MTAGEATLVQLTMADLALADLERAGASALEGAELDAIRETALGRAFEVERAALTPDGRLLLVHLGARRSRRTRRAQA